MNHNRDISPLYQPILDIQTMNVPFGDQLSTLNRIRNFCETFLSMSILPDLIWWLQPELASKTPEIKK